MTPVFLGLGSNIEPARYLPVGLQALEDLLGDVQRSAVYEGEAMGFAGDPFWNLVVAVHTPWSVGDLQRALRAVEYAQGRPRKATRYSARTLDIDILTYGDHTGTHHGVELPRGEILEHAFVLRPLAELAPDALHPLLKRPYAALWAEFDQASQPLRAVSL
ncbi:MAG: 2-amino-4-hydroxy-6-hydroxymethyldihydropteridine diphosphokinase [Halieaceae bacterium]